jgi:arylsulfatase A-like enzyme
MHRFVPVLLGLPILLAPGLLAATPNVVIIMADDLGWGDVGYPQARTSGDTFNGHPLLRTPHLAEMAAMGLKFNRFYAASPVCSPTRASMLTGRHGARHGIDGALMPGDTGKIRNRELTIAELAKTHGYTTGHFGKWHVGSLTKHTYDMRRGRVGNYRDYSPPWCNGYDVAFASENWMPTYDPYDAFPHNNAAQAAYFTGPSNPGLSSRVPNDGQVDDRHESAIVTKQLLKFIARSHASGQPFFATVWFATPHVPLMETPDSSYDNLGLSAERRRYFEAVTEMDKQVGRIRRTLCDLELSDDTLVLFTSDNGPQSEKVGSNGGLRGHKASLWEGGIRVPALVEWHGHVSQGADTNAPVTSSDLLATLLDLWGASMPDSRPLDGASFKPILDGSDERSDFQFHSLFGPQQMAMDRRYKLISSSGGTSYQMFDLLNDPGEKRNLLEGSPSLSIAQKRDALVDGLHQWIASCHRSATGGDLPTRVSSTINADVKANVDQSLELHVIGEDSFGAPVYDDRYNMCEGTFEHSQRASLFVERQYATLPCSISVDSGTETGSSAVNGNLGIGTVHAGAICHSFLLHFDPVDDARRYSVEVKITFEDPIKAVITRSDRLDASDFLAFAEPGFPADDTPRSSTREPSTGEANDSKYSTTPDGRTITVYLTAGADEIDQLRILTAARVQWHKSRLPPRQQQQVATP